jgi:predicted hydrocarbon binding protein
LTGQGFLIQIKEIGNIEAGRAGYIELTETKVIVRDRRCVMGLYGARKEVCQAIMAVDKAMLSELAGKSLRMEIKKTLAANDEYCEIEFTVDE